MVDPKPKHDHAIEQVLMEENGLLMRDVKGLLRRLKKAEERRQREKKEK